MSAPTTVRYRILALACSLSMLTYVDRVALSVASGSIVETLHLNSIADLKWAFAIFAFCYAMFEIPTGWWGDMRGPRHTLLRIVVWWSVCVALIGATGLQIGGIVLGLGFLILVNAIFGIGEAGAYPNLNRALYGWFPAEERGLAQGSLWMCAKLAGGLTPVLWMILVQGVDLRPLGASLTLSPILPSWRSAFFLFGVIGMVWCLLFWKFFRNHPREIAAVNDAELELIESGQKAALAGHGKVPWKRIFSSRNLWFLCLMYGCQAYGWYFNITYLPRFLEQQYHVTPDSLVGSIYKGGPLWMGAIGCLLGGILTDRFVKRTASRKMGRRICGLVGHAGCVCCFLIAPYMTTAFGFFLVISLAAFFTDSSVPSAWAICQDIGHRYTAIVSAIMNTTAGLFGALAGIVTGYVLEHHLSLHAARLNTPVTALTSAQQCDGLMGGYHTVFLIFAVAYLIAFASWFFIDAEKPVCP
ncbi:MAG: hypothetical protein B9S32_00895 [Verrucomicrobia bacterium Tous-C9LFEB]|nr:MAG: hypothetical protein B9S32_00895 [Verrucomicrobia bacterium Tous-C9LFEB]